MRIKKNTAFTLIEMLVVVIIIGVILAIAIPSVSNLINRNRVQKYQVFMQVVEEKTKLYVDSHKGEFQNSTATCFQLNYEDLVKQDVITEGDVTCTGSIIVTKSGNGRNFTSEYYLSCNDEHGDSLHKSATVPTGCQAFTSN